LPTTAVVLDFETFFDQDYSLSKMSTIEYITDPRFEVIGLACHISDQPFTPRRSTFWWGEGAGQHLRWLQQEYGFNLEDCTVVIQNARFDATILAKHYDIYPQHIVDVKYLSAHLDARARHSLKSLCKRYSLPAKGDTMQFQGVHLAGMTPAQQQAMASYANNDAEREMDLFAILLPKLTRPEVELPLMHHTVEMYTKPLLGFDFKEAESLVVDLDKAVASAISATGLDHETLSGNNSFIEVLAATLPEGEAVPMKQGKKKMIAALAKNDEGLKDLQHHTDPRVRTLIAGRQAVKSFPLHIKRVQKMAAQAKANGGSLPNALSYYAAHTGRWGGSEGINTQNLSSRGTGLVNRVRGTIIAPEGKALIVADAAQIEARILAWLAGDDELLAAFARNEDIYSRFISKVLGQPCRKPSKDDLELVRAVLSWRRALGKIGILGMGFGMGAVRALEYITEYAIQYDVPSLLARVESGEVDLAFCKRFVDSYRAEYPKIPLFWKTVEHAFRVATKYGTATDVSVKGGVFLSFFRQGTTTVIRLPSGRCLFYEHARVVQGEKYEELRWHWGKLWGGVITENVVQSISRDILGEAILACEDDDLPIGHHIHDELVGVVDKAVAQAALARMIGHMRVRPSWAQDLPLDAEGHVCSKYGKG
jgi:DNA polymerase